MTREELVHLAGYSTLALILGTANWSMFGWAFVLPLVLGTLAYAGYLGTRVVIRMAREELPSPAREPTAATDGGRQLSETDTGGSQNSRNNT